MAGEGTNGTSSAAASKGQAKNEGGKQNQEKQQPKVATPPLVPLSNTYLEELSRRIRSRPIPWEGYARADLVSQEELRMIRSIDGKSDDEIEKLLDDEGEKYAALYVRLLAKLTRTDTLQRILVLVGDMLQGHDDRAAHFLKVKAPDQGTTWPWQPLIKLIDSQDEFCQLKASQFLTLLLVYPTRDEPRAPSHVLDRLLTFLSALINSGAGSGTTAFSGVPGAGALRPPLAQGGYAEGNGADIGIQLLEALLRSQTHRLLVWKDEMRKIGQATNAIKKHDEDKRNRKTLHKNDGDGDDDEDDDDDDATEDGKSSKDRPSGREIGKKAQQSSEMESILFGLRSILMASLAGKSGGGSGSSGGYGSSKSGTSTPQPSQSSQATRVNQSEQSSTGSRTPVGQVGVQLVYQVVFCLWLFSFDENIAGELNVKFGFIPILADLARAAIKEKVVRVILATLRNMVEKAPTANTSALLGSKGLELMNTLNNRKWSDEEIPEDIKAIKEILNEKLKVMSSYDQYISELSSGRLSWDNPAHSLDDFWKENSSKLLEAPANEEEQRASGVTMLVDLLKDSENKDATTLAIVCNDIGRMLTLSASEGSSINSSARKEVEKLGGKTYMLALISHQDGQVKFHALRTVSKLVSGSWRSS